MEEYKYILIPLLSIVVAQIIKTIIETISTKRFSLERLFNGAGGMPSTHTTAVISLTTLMYIDYGLNSELFAICLIFSLIVMYDAMGIRYETGKQAEIINLLAKKAKLKESFVLLKEKIGHKPIEVLGGIITGIVLTVIFNNILICMAIA